VVGLTNVNFEFNQGRKCDSVGEAISAASLLAPGLPIGEASSEFGWYALQIRGRFEKKVAAQLQDKAIETFLPLLRQVHQWSDRRRDVDLPLFPGYAFIHSDLCPEIRLRVMQTAGVMGFVTINGRPDRVDDKQIEDLQIILEQKAPCSIHPFLRVGQRVRIRGGSLEGVEGLLVAQKSKNMVLLSIDAIQRSIAVSLEGYDLEIIGASAPWNKPS
jgi:transcription antitermination factor NusG